MIRIIRYIMLAVFILVAGGTLLLPKNYHCLLTTLAFISGATYIALFDVKVEK